MTVRDQTRTCVCAASATRTHVLNITFPAHILCCFFFYVFFWLFIRLCCNQTSQEFCFHLSLSILVSFLTFCGSFNWASRMDNQANWFYLTR